MQYREGRKGAEDCQGDTETELVCALTLKCLTRPCHTLPLTQLPHILIEG
jgi:hypothetical protein